GRAAFAARHGPIPSSKKSNDVVADRELGGAHLTTYLHVPGSPSNCGVWTLCFLQLTIAPRTATALLGERGARGAPMGPEPDGHTQIPLISASDAPREREGDIGAASG